MTSIECRDLSVSYGKRVVLHPFSALVESGEWLGLIGPNGAGKSTLLKAIVGLAASSGEIVVDGESIDLRTRSQRAALVAFVPQDPMLPADMTGFEYVLMGRAPYIGYFSVESSDDKAMVHDVLARLGLSAFADRKLARLSGGERQRLVIARALATEAPILLLDEPTSALDIGHQQQALELVTELRAEHGLTVIAAMHDLTLASMYGDRLVLLHEGVVAAAGRPCDVLRPETLAEFYGVRVSVHHESDGTVVVVPRRD